MHSKGNKLWSFKNKIEGSGRKRAQTTKQVNYRTIRCTPHTPGPIFMVDISTVGIVSAKTVGVGNISPRPWRKRIVRYWHPLGCRAIGLGKPPQGCVTYTIGYTVIMGSLPHVYKWRYVMTAPVLYPLLSYGGGTWICLVSLFWTRRGHSCRPFSLPVHAPMCLAHMYSNPAAYRFSKHALKAVCTLLTICVRLNIVMKSVREETVNPFGPSNCRPALYLEGVISWSCRYTQDGHGRCTGLNHAEMNGNGTFSGISTWGVWCRCWVTLDSLQEVITAVVASCQSGLFTALVAWASTPKM